MRPTQPVKLRGRGPAEWVQCIRQLSGHGLRTRVANIVWWDFFADRKGYGAELEHWLQCAFEEESVETPDEDVMAGLRECGYSAEMVAAKFKKKSQLLDQGKGSRHGPLKRRDCSDNRAKHWTRKERSVRIA